MSFKALSFGLVIQPNQNLRLFRPFLSNFFRLKQSFLSEKNFCHWIVEQKKLSDCVRVKCWLFLWLKQCSRWCVLRRTLARSIRYEVFLPPWNASAYCVKRSITNAALSAFGSCSDFNDTNTISATLRPWNSLRKEMNNNWIGPTDIHSCMEWCRRASAAKKFHLS